MTKLLLWVVIAMLALTGAMASITIEEGIGFNPSTTDATYITGKEINVNNITLTTTELILDNDTGVLTYNETPSSATNYTIYDSIVNLGAKDIFNHSIQTWTLHRDSYEELKSGTEETTASSSYVSAYNITAGSDEEFIFSTKFLLHATSGETATARSTFYYTDGTSSDAEIPTTSTSYVNLSINNPNLEKKISRIEVDFKTSSGGTAFIDNLYWNISTYQETQNYNMTTYMDSAVTNTFLFTSNVSEYYQKYQTFSPTAWTTTSDHFTNLYNTIINVTPTEYYSGASILTFSTTFNNTANSFTLTNTSTTGSLLLYGLQDTNFTYTTEATSYFDNVSTFSVSATTDAYNVRMFGTRNATLNFYDEVTLLPLTNVNVTVTSDNGYGVEFNTATYSNYTIKSLTDGFYTITYSRDNYTQRDYFFNIPLESTTSTNATLYLIDNTTAQSFTVTVTDTNNQYIQDVLVVLLRRYVENDQTVYKTVEMVQPAALFDGSVTFSAEPNTAAYLFRVVNKDTFEVLFQGAGITTSGLESVYLDGTEVTIRFNPVASNFENFRDLQDFEYSLSKTNTTFFLSWSDVSSVTSSVCLNVKENNTLTLFNQCADSNNATAIISYETPYINGSYYVATASAVMADSGDTERLDTDVIDLRNDRGAAIFGGLGIFVLILTLIAVGVGFASSPQIAVVLGAMAFIAFGTSFLGIIALSLPLQGAILFITVLAVFAMRRTA